MDREKARQALQCSFKVDAIGIREKAQLVKCLLCKYKELSSVPQNKESRSVQVCMEFQHGELDTSASPVLTGPPA